MRQEAFDLWKDSIENIGDGCSISSRINRLTPLAVCTICRVVRAIPLRQLCNEVIYINSIVSATSLLRVIPIFYYSLEALLHHLEKIESRLLLFIFRLLHA